MKAFKISLPKKETMYMPYNDYDVNGEGVLKYFVGGDGWKKTKKFEIVELDITNELNMMGSIREAYELYGWEICQEMVTNHSENWKHAMVKLAINSNITNEEQNLIESKFKISILECYDWRMLSLGAYPSFDVIGFDNHLRIKFGFDPMGGISTKDFIANKFSKELMKLVESKVRDSLNLKYSTK